MALPFWIALAFFSGWCSGVLAAPWFSRSARRERAMAYLQALTAYVDAMGDTFGPDASEVSEGTVKRVERLKVRYEETRADLRVFL